MSKSTVPIKEFRLELSDLTYTGRDLVRPESVLAQPNGTAEPSDRAMAAGPNLQFITSLAFGGPDLRTAYLGSLAMSTLPTFQSPVAGLPMRHWK